MQCRNIYELAAVICRSVKLKPMDRISFCINGETHSVGSEISSDVTLLDYLRNHLELRGTKYMCRQAGCGACIVAAARTPGETPHAVNSCMVSITSCKDWQITTIEELGNRKKGYHILQKTLANHNGSQCGYCSPGWIMSMYCLLQKKKDLSMLDIEKSFGSNICRCTGYRPILEAFKAFAKDAPKDILQDIEDLNICKKTGKVCHTSCDEDEDWCIVSAGDVEGTVTPLILKDGRKWFQAYSVSDVFSILKEEGYDSYMLIAGNTAKGVYPIVEYPRTLIDISRISTLKGYSFDQNLVIGAGNTLTELLEIFNISRQKADFGYLKEFCKHLQVVAHVAVRNLGTIAGNLMIKQQHKEFASDLFVLFTTVGAVLTIMNNKSSLQILTMQQFLDTNMRGSVIVNVKLPPIGSNGFVRTYKVMPRSQNAHAIVNFGAFYSFSQTGDRLHTCSLAFGGLSPEFSKAKATAKFLIGKTLFTNETLQSAIKILEQELVVMETPPEPTAAYRRKLAVALFYKSLLSLCPKNILKEKYISGSITLHEARPVSKATQSFETIPSLWPLNKPIPKLESLIQCAGEATYAEDTPSLPREVFADIVLSSVAKGYIFHIDPSKALEYPGVIAFYTAKDIPGLNSYVPIDDIQSRNNEEVLSSGEIKYYNQPIAIVVAETRHIAEVASKMIEVTYENLAEPIIDIKVSKKLPKRNTLFASRQATEKGNQTIHTVKGSQTIYGQYHFTLETFAVVTRPIEEGLEIYASSHWPDAIQTMVSRALNLDANRIDVNVRRLGGGFGIKLTRIILSAVVCSLVTKKLNRPCRVIHSIETIMRAFGKRFPCSSDYEFAVDKNGVIQSANFTIYEDNGFELNEKLEQLGINMYSNCYDKIKNRINYQLFDNITDTAKNTWFRAPGKLETVAMVEMVMEQISYEQSLDSVQLRLANIDPTSSDISTMIGNIMIECEYNARKIKIKEFNAKNRWKKRGFRFVPLQWKNVFPAYRNANISVFHSDGSVAITHGGVELGQGINTRAAQICAYFLKIPLEKIQVKATSTTGTPNNNVTAGSLTSQQVGLAARRCCEELLRRLEPSRAKLANPCWEELITQAFNDNVDLQVHGFVGKDDIFQYYVYGVAFAEVKIDVLTGEIEIKRVDVMVDAGQSVSPALDIGQIEGAFVQGLGYWTCENLVYDKTGELLTDRSWNYYVPQARDIPQDFRVYLRKRSYSVPSILGAKGISEPPICLSVVVPMAIREAITAARLDSGIPTTTWYPIDGPYTVEKICMVSCTKIEEYKFY